MKVALCAKPVALLKRHDAEEMVGQYWADTLPISPLLYTGAHGNEIKLVSDESERASGESDREQEKMTAGGVLFITRKHTSPLS